MKIRMTTGLSGPDFNLAPGDERDFESEEAQRLIDAGFAELATKPKGQTATKAAAPETRSGG